MKATLSIVIAVFTLAVSMLAQQKTTSGSAEGSSRPAPQTNNNTYYRPAAPAPATTPVPYYPTAPTNTNVGPSTPSNSGANGNVRSNNAPMGTPKSVQGQN